jgi:hypothetical protein
MPLNRGSVVLPPRNQHHLANKHIAPRKLTTHDTSTHHAIPIPDLHVLPVRHRADLAGPVDCGLFPGYGTCCRHSDTHRWHRRPIVDQSGPEHDL